MHPSNREKANPPISIDPRLTLREMNKQGIVATLVDYDDMKGLIVKAYQCK
jgi:hypothetical protein